MSPNSPRTPDQYETPTRRIILLGVAFAALVAIGVVTVLRPELEQEPESTSAVDEAGDTDEAAPAAPAAPTPAP